MMEGRKRKAPARAARVEAENKKKRTGTSTPPESSKAPTPVPVPVVVEETLPKSISTGKPLPTVNTPQSDNLSAKEYQSIPQSGVLQESLARSKARWIVEGIFERYWTKPTKKKGEKELANNPGKDTMTKLGTCTITIEPHVFDATMYAIKDPDAKKAPPPMPQQPMYRPIIQYGPPNGTMPPPQQLQPALPVQPQPPQQYPPNQSVQISSRQSTPMKNGGTVSTTTPTQINTYGTPNTGQAQPRTSYPQPNGVQGQPQQQPQQQPSPAPAPAPKGTDPVIQMLAERAATDADLKALMRIVANGEATPEELKKFQGHIDELTRLTQARQAAAAAAQQQRTSSAGPLQQAQQPLPQRTYSHPPAQTTQARPNPPNTQPQSQALRSKGPVPTRSDISGVVLEFTGGSGDRFLFPKFSILEHLPQGQVIASFLIVRKGSSSDSPKYDPQLDYYQPITIRLYTHQGRQLDSLAKVVASPEEVRRYMDDIMDNTTRAEYVLLAMQLPKDTDPSPADEENESAVVEVGEKNNGVLWGATTKSVPIARVKPQKPLISEQEQYESFIASVRGEVL